MRTVLETPTRRDQILDTAARLFAQRGFHGVSIADLGAACGISGPALYKHFAGKESILAEMLVGISEELLAEGRARVGTDAEASLAASVFLPRMNQKASSGTIVSATNSEAVRAMATVTANGRNSSPVDPDTVDAVAGEAGHRPGGNEPPVLTVPFLVAPAPLPPVHILGASIAPRWTSGGRRRARST